MGLAERRAVKAYQDNHFPAWKQAIDAAAGFTVELEVEWPTLAADGYDHMYQEAFDKVYFEPLVGALKDVCQDDMGREALRDGLKRVVVCNRSGTYGESAITFQSGVLTIDHEPVTNLSDVSLRQEAIVKNLEKGL